MHPIERLRWVARAPEADVGLAAVEAAEALAAFADDPPGLVIACRRLIERRPSAGPLWWLGSRVLCALDPVAEAYAAMADLERDPTATLLSLELPGGTIAVVGWPELASQALRSAERVAVVEPSPGRGVSPRYGDGRRLLRRLEHLGIDARIAGPEAAARRAALVLLEAHAAGPAGFVAAAGSTALARAARDASVPVWLVVGVGRRLPGALFDALTTHLHLDPGDPEVLAWDAVEEVAGPGGRVAPGTAATGSRSDCPVAPELLHLPH
ncbi:MAG: hypothetical protein ACRDZ7_00495 [Acidimicrobiia bacterium]